MPPSFAKAWQTRACLAWDTLYPSDIVAFVESVYSTTSSQSCALRSFRAFARRYYPEIPDSWVGRAKLPRFKIYLQRKKDAQRVQEKADNPLTCNVQAYLAFMCELLAKDDVVALGLGLLMATGRRTKEIATCGKLRPTRKAHVENRSYWLRFSGPAKKRKAESAKLAWDIPLLAHGEQVFAAFTRFRELAAGTNVKSKLWQQDIKALLHDRFPDFALKTCRAIYTRLSFELFNPFVAINTWTMRILGHTSIRIGLAYLNVRLANCRTPEDTHGILLPGFDMSRC